MEWKYIKPLQNNSIFEDIEKTYNIDIPAYLKEIITKYNGGRPERRLFDTQNSKERVLQGLISFNKDDKANILIYENLLRKGYIPFAITEFGDIICVNVENSNIELYIQEQDKFEYVCKSMDLFFDKLYK